MSDRLGMHEPISRRDFLNGTLLAGAGLVLGPRLPGSLQISPADAWNGYGGVGDCARAPGHMCDDTVTPHRPPDDEFERALAGPTDPAEMYHRVAAGGALTS